MTYAITHVPLVYGNGWGERDLPATEAWLHHPAMGGEPGEDATLEQDIAYFRRVEQVGYDRFQQYDIGADGKDEWPAPTGAGISYTYLVMRSGRIIAGHDPKRQSSHTKGHNYAGIGISWAGNFVDGSLPSTHQVNATVWLLGEAVRLGVLAQPRLDGGHRDVYATSCPAAAYPYITTVNELVTSGGTMARRKPTAADIRNKEAELRLRGFDIYCGPSFYAKGYCAPGKHPHSSDSRHFAGMALDVGMDPASGAPVSDHERAHLDLLMHEFDADPYIDWRIRWRDPEGTHHDHLHVDDSSWFETKNVSGALAKDGSTVFISHKAFPKHVPAINGGFTLAYIAEQIQPRLKILGRYTGTPDGYKGTGTTAGIVAFQRDANLVDDGAPGEKTLAALKVAVAEHLAPKIPDPVPTPQPTPQPVPEPEPDFPGGRLAGANRYDTAAQVARQAPPERQAKVYLTAEGTNDVAASASAGDGVVLLARSGGDVLPGVTAAALTDLPVRELVIVGGTASIPETVARQARHAASL